MGVDEVDLVDEVVMTAGMRRWVARLGAGYVIRPRLRMGPRGYVVWGPALFNAEGAFVQNVRRDTFRRLSTLVEEGVLEVVEGVMRAK